MLPKELIVISDGESDIELNKLIDKKCNFIYEKLNIKSNKYHFTKNKGAAIAYNKAVELSKYDFVIRCDADDFSLRDRFLKTMKKLSAGFTLCGAQMNEYIDNEKSFSFKPLEYSSIKKRIKYRNPFNHPTVGFNKNFFLELGGYKKVAFKEDYLLWIKWVAKNDKICNLNESLVTTLKNSNFIARRGGLINIYSEFVVYLYIIKYKFNNFLFGFIIFVLRLTLLMLPFLILKKFYKLFLR